MLNTHSQDYQYLYHFFISQVAHCPITKDASILLTTNVLTYILEVGFGQSASFVQWCIVEAWDKIKNVDGIE